MNSYEDPQLSYECDREARICQLETQVQEFREALERIYGTTIDTITRETARAILEKTK